MLNQAAQKAAYSVAPPKEVPKDEVTPAKVTPAKKQSTPKELYGNQDDDKEFDLRQLSALETLPDDKVVLLIPQYNTDSTGNKIGYDLKNCRVQFVDPLQYDQATKTDESTGSTAYEMLAVDPIVLHDPRKK
jgi:hypothetical protein